MGDGLVAVEAMVSVLQSRKGKELKLEESKCTSQDLYAGGCQ
jgi:hypothetical protein